jgi:RES domain-containing protein
VGTCYRAHDPRWSFSPLSGDGAAIHGGRFNPRGVPALYLALDIMTAIREVSHGFAHRLDPLVLCSYEVDCDNIVDLTGEVGRAEASVTGEELSCAWASALAEGRRPASWSIHDRLTPQGIAGVLVPSFAPGAADDDRNLVLWHWSPGPPHKVQVFDPSGRLPRDQLSWSPRPRPE